MSLYRVAPIGGGASYQFTCYHSQGAILHLPDGANRHNLRNLRKFRELALDHGASWYKHAREYFGRDAPSGSLCLVTGCDKSSSWAIASFSDVSEDSGISLKFTTAPVGDLTAAYRSSWDNHSPAIVRTIDGSRDKQNQCVFIRGFRIALRESPIVAKILGTVKLTSTPDSKSPKSPGGHISSRRSGPQSALGGQTGGSNSGSHEQPNESDSYFEPSESPDDEFFDLEILQELEITPHVELFPSRPKVSFHLCYRYCSRSDISNSCIPPTSSFATLF
jgi:hypothetical protein